MKQEHDDDDGDGDGDDGDYDGDGDDLKDGEDSTFVLQQLRPILHPLCLGHVSSQTTDQTIGRYLFKSNLGFVLHGIGQGTCIRMMKKPWRARMMLSCIRDRASTGGNSSSNQDGKLPVKLD